jgi:hypothetical protein
MLKQPFTTNGSVTVVKSRAGPLSRAYGLQGETAKARAASQQFLTLRKDADLNIPILKQAEARLSD